MQINPGGRLNTSDVVGRDNEIARYWRVLERQGLIISAERRIGKTHIVLKMRDECVSGFLPFYQDLESVHSTAELIRSVYATVHQSLNTLPGLRAHVAKWSSLLPEKIGSVDLPAGAGAWQALLSQAFDDLIDIADERLILMLWDEFPLMLHNLQRNEGNDAVIRLLDFLRALRLAHAHRLRLLFAGEVGGFPYYIHHVVDQLDQLRRPPALEDVSSAVDALVYDPHDPANLNYYLTRLSSYYADDERSLALVVLDTMAGQATPTPVEELLNLCKHRDPSLADEQLREILAALAEDHYIEPKKCASGAAYDFRWQLVRKWWKERRS